MDLADRIATLQRQKASAGGARTRGVVNLAAAAGNSTNGRGERERSPAVVTAAQQTLESSPLNPNITANSHSPHSPRRSSAGPTQTQAQNQGQGQGQYQGQGQRTKQLFNPDSDPIPMRSRSPPQMTVDHHNVHNGNSSHRPPQPQRQLFDPRRDDPMRFAALNNTQRAHPPPSTAPSSSLLDGSSISSYTSSAWTLTSSTGTSHSSAPPENPPEKDASGKFIEMLKKIYREITDLEKKTQDWDKAEPGEIPAAAITMLKPGVILETVGLDNEPPDPLRALVAQHKKLSELYHSMISMILQPVPASMLSFVTKYSLPNRLWTNGINHCLEGLRRMSSRLPNAVEHMNEYIYWAYHFYESLYITSCVEGSFMAPYSQHWIEALGDLARYRMQIVARQAPHQAIAPSVPLTEANLPPSIPSMDDTQPPSIGLAALGIFDSEPEVEVWRKSSQSWYSMNVKETPGAGKLHHNLGLLTVDAANEELRGVYHFVKSMTANHPYPASREAILPLFSSSAQNRRNLAEAKSPELFVLLHGMLFTHIQLDNFQPTLARYLERLQLDGAQEREWIMMAVINVAAILEYGKNGLIKTNPETSSSSSATAGRRKELVAKMDSLAMNDVPSSSKMDLDATSPTGEVVTDAMPVDIPYALQLSMQLTFSTLSFCLRHPYRQSSPFSRPTLNPYITILLTFIASMVKQSSVLAVIERSFPWDDLVNFLATAPPSQTKVEVAARAKITSGCHPLPEDWCLRGMGWLNRRVYEHGFWKTRSSTSSSSSNNVSSEMDVLSTFERSEQDTDGVIEDNEVSDAEDSPKVNTKRRWVRLIRAGLALVHYVPGLEFNGAEMRWELGEVMRVKAEAWKEEERREREEDERRRNRHWGDDEDDEMDVDVEEEEEEEEWDSDPEIQALQERRQYLRTLQNGGSSTANRRSSYMRPARRSAPSRPALNVRPGYTVLVVDTNILLSALPMITTLIESERWTILIPLAVITELDGLSANRSDLGKAASNASQYITSHIRSHSSSLKVQTSRGNYLTTLNIRSENFDFSSRHRNGDGDEQAKGWERNLDDLILRAAMWQESHWVDRSPLLRGITNPNSTKPPLNPPVPRGDEAKVVLVTFDRNLRLKARARQLHAGDERDLAHILRFETS